MATLCRRLTTLLSRLAAKLARVYHIRPYGRHFHLDIASGVTPTGALATFKSPGPLPTLPVGGTVTPFGSLFPIISGPSLVTIPQSVDGTITPSSTLFNEATGLGIIITQAVDGQILPTGEPTNEASGPSLVTVLQSVSGQVGPTASVARVTNASTGLVTDSRAGTITPAGAVATLAGGPSFVTLTKAVAGSITPSGGVTTSVGSVTVVFNQQATGVATPTGSVARVVSGPSLVTVTKSVAGTITPAAAPVNVVKNPLTGISTQAVDGTVTPSATVVRQVSGPSLITVTASRAGTITPAGTVARAISGSNQFQINKQGVVTPAGVVGRVVSGPSFVTVLKSVASSMSPSGTVARLVSGPSNVTIPKTVSGLITPHGSETRLVTGNTTIQKAISGRITPSSVVTKLVQTIGTTPNPLYTGWMSHDDISTWANPPHFTTTQIVPTPSTIAAIRTAARANGFKLALRLSGNSPLYAGHDTSGQPCCFDLTKWKNAVARFQNLISSADADWLWLNYLIDEPYINNWYGNTLSTNILKQMAQYSRQLYPWLGTTVRSESKYLTGNQLPAGGWGGFLTHGWANYNRSAINNNLNYSQYFTLNTNEFAAVGIDCILGQNIFNSGLGGSGIPSSDGISGHWFASAQEIKDCFDAAYPFSKNKIYQIWKQAETGDSTEPYIPYMTRADYVSAWNYLVSRGGSRATGGSSGGNGVQAVMADSLVDSMSVQLHLGSSAAYSGNWTNIVRPRLLELGIRHTRERLFTDTTVIARYQDLAVQGVRLTAGCWPNGAPYNDAAHIITRSNAYGTAVIEAFDGWNEVENQPITGVTWPQAWVTWQTTLYNAIKANATWSNRVVMGNSLAHAASCDQVGLRTNILDAGNLHSYPSSSGLPSNLTASWIPQWQKISGTKPLYTTETGYHTCPTCTTAGVSELAQAKYIGRLWFEYFNHGIVRTNWYEFLDEGTSTTDREDHWGLLRFDGTKKASYDTTKNIIALLSDLGAAFQPGRLNYTMTNTASSVHTTLLQKRNGRWYLVIWQDLSVWSTGSSSDVTNATRSMQLNLPFSSTQINVYRPRTGITAIQQGSGNVITLAVPDELLIVEIVP